MFWALRSGFGKMQVPVLVYILVILIMSGLAWERHLQLELPQTLFAACGAILFLISDALRLESISDEIQIHAIFIWDTYYVAQWTLAMSLGQLNDYYLS